MVKAAACFGLQRVPLVLAFLVAVGCAPPAKVPIDTIHYESKGLPGNRILLVFLPGNGDPVSVFEKEGIVEAVRNKGVPADMIAVNAHIGYYLNGSVFTRLKEDVINPARARGYAQIWMIGDSLGAYGSISYLRQYPEDLAGVVLLGPFLGDRDLIDEIERAGGLQAWDPGPTGNDSMEAWNRHIWLFLKADEKGARRKIYEGYGTHDRFSLAQASFAYHLPAERVIRISGGHDWSTWRKIWGLFLEQNIFGKP